MAPELPAQYPVLLLQGAVPVLPAPLPHGHDGLPDPFARCLALDYPVSLPRSRPVVGESEKVECVVPTGDLFVVRRFPERE